MYAIIIYMDKLEGVSTVIEFGPKNTEPVPLSCINELEQIRKTYDPQAIEDLARSMKHENSETGEISFDMYNPPLTAYLSYEEAKEYLSQHAAFYGSSRTIDEIVPDRYGNYVILISGHRRKRAIEFLMDGNGGVSPDQVNVNVNLRRGITFEEALIAQIRENTYEKVSPVETAKNIEQLYIYLRDRTGKKPTHREIAAKTGLSENVVGTALQFQQLPDSIKILATTHGDILPYSTLIKLEPLMRKYGELYDLEKSFGSDMGNESREIYIENKLHIATNQIVRLRLKAEKIISYIQNLKQNLEEQILNAQPTFELDYEPGTAPQLRKSYHSLAKQALSALELAIKSDPTSVPLNEIEKLLEQARQAASPINQHQEALVF